MMIKESPRRMCWTRLTCAAALAFSVSPATACARIERPAPLVAATGGSTAISSQAVVPSGATAKNVIIVIGDGMGYNHVRAANLYLSGRPVAQEFERFPTRVAMATFAHPDAGGRYDPREAWRSFEYVTGRATASAGAATAMSTGTKTRASYVGVDLKGRPLTHNLDVAESRGRSTGVVTSVPLSHATPAGFSAHRTDRNDFPAIANEMLGASRVDVIMGAGHPLWSDSGTRRPASEADYDYVGGLATWERLLTGTAGADADGDGDADPFELVTTPRQFEALTTGTAPGRVAGVAQCATTLQQARRGATDSAPFAVATNTAVPSLATMAQGALNVLDEDPDGLYLVIESGAIDWAAALNQKGRLVEEQAALFEAVDAVIDWVETESSWTETLVIVTGDHETGYLTGPFSGQYSFGPVWNPLLNRGKGTLPEMRFNSRDHTNSLVPLWAKGPGARELRAAVAGTDPVRGPYIDNTAVAKTVRSVMR